MDSFNTVGWLFFMTLGIVLVAAIYQWQRTKRSQIKSGQKPGTLGRPGDPKP